MVMMSPPVITVIIPTYNSSGTLKLAVETVLRQTFGNFEVWIVGDGCTDDSESVVRSFGDERLHWTNLSRNSGTPSRPRNEGLGRAKGRYIAYLGHDDLWFPWHLEGLIERFRNEGWEFGVSLGVIIGPEGIDSFFSLPRNLKPGHGEISPSNWMHDRSLTARIGAWSLKTRIGDDQDFLKRVWASPAKSGFHRRLSVIKFPSISWRLYSMTSEFPQERYAEDLACDAESLSRDLISNYLAEQSMRDGGLRKKRRGEPLYGLIRPLLRFYGYNRWPLSRIQAFRYRRKRGLSS